MSRFAFMVYLAVMNVGAPLAGLLLLPMLVFSRKRRKTLLPRLGLQRYPRAGEQPSATRGKSVAPVWVHALSVGELLSGVPLLRELRRRLPSRPLYLSVSTLAAHELATEKLAAQLDGLFYFPYDLLLPVHQCLRQIRPALFLLIETDIWPGFLAQMRLQRIPCMLLNARLSPSSFRFTRWFSALFQPAFATFDRIYPQSPAESERFLALGLEAGKLHRPGNLKFDLALPLLSPRSASDLRRRYGIGEQDQVLLAGSTHPGEEAILRSVFLALRKDYPELILMVVPRHPKRAAEVARLFADDRMRVVLSSRKASGRPDVVVVDRMGLLGGLYALADVTFVGGSLVKQGGQNPIEPAAAGKPVLFGPDMSDFPQVSQWLIEGGGAILVQNPEELLTHSRRLLADPALAMAVGRKARTVVDEHQGSSRQIAEEMVAFLETAESSA